MKNTLLKMKSHHTLKFFASIALIIALQACGGSSNEQKVVEQTQSTPVNTIKSPTSFYINSGKNEGLAELIIEGENVIVRRAGGDLFGELKGDKRKYYNQNDQFRNAVKYKEDAFKLRDENEELLWKVKIYEDKIKLANNEEMTNAYKISLSESNKIKIKRDEEEVAALRLVSNDAFVNVNEKYVVRNFGTSLAIGVLMIDEIQEDHKFLICAELLKMGK